MPNMEEKLYKALKKIIAPGGGYRHINTEGFMDWLVVGEEINLALDLLAEYDAIHGIRK